MSWYRNPIREVASFLDERHPGVYRVYNLCSERTYDDAHFHNRVFHWPMDDHNVPTVREMVDFVDQVRTYKHAAASRCEVRSKSRAHFANRSSPGCSRTTATSSPCTARAARGAPAP